TWDNPRTESNPAGDDLDLFLWPDDDPVFGGPSSECGSPGTAACDNLYPEVIAMIEPEDTVEPPDTPPGDQLDPKLFTVVNHIGVNSGYTLRFEWFTFDVEFGDFSKAKRGGGPLIGSSNPSATPTFDPTALRGVQGPRKDRKILLPGTDGQLVDIQLPLLAAGKVPLRPPDKGGGLGPLAIGGAGLGAVFVGLGGYTVIRRRRLSRG
ncbi:MAG: hypothetical protein ACREQY_20955, partial [Candidatus Binatia bacterium]